MCLHPAVRDQWSKLGITGCKRKWDKVMRQLWVCPHWSCIFLPIIWSKSTEENSCATPNLGQTGLPKLTPLPHCTSSLMNMESTLWACWNRKLLFCYYYVLLDKAAELWKDLGFGASSPGGHVEGYPQSPSPPPFCWWPTDLSAAPETSASPVHPWMANYHLLLRTCSGTRGISTIWSLLEMQNLRLHPRPTESESAFWQAPTVTLCMLKFVTHWFTKLNQLRRKWHWKKRMSL